MLSPIHVLWEMDPLRTSTHYVVAGHRKREWTGVSMAVTGDGSRHMSLTQSTHS